jgi:hypothetical protein
MAMISRSGHNHISGPKWWPEGGRWGERKRYRRGGEGGGHNLWLETSTLSLMQASLPSPIVARVRFYKYYLHTKAFTLWRNNVRFKLYCQQVNQRSLKSPHDRTISEASADR